MAERAKLWVYLVFGAFFTVLYSVVSHWIWHSGGWLYSNGMQDFAGSTVVHYQGALAALAGALLLGPRIGKFGQDGRANPIPGHNMPYAVLGTLILWFGWFGFNAGSTLGVVTGDKVGYFAYVALTTNVAAAAGALGGIGAAWLVLRKPDVSMMLNGVIAALVAITAACGFVSPWAAVVIGAVAGSIAVVGVLWVERIGIDDPISASQSLFANSSCTFSFSSKRLAAVHTLAVCASWRSSRPRSRRRCSHLEHDERRVAARSIAGRTHVVGGLMQELAADHGRAGKTFPRGSCSIVLHDLAGQPKRRAR